MTQLRSFVLAVAAGVVLAGAGATAQERAPPSPRIVIYPGDVIRDDMLVDGDAMAQWLGGGPFVESRSALIGKTARLTLLPGRAIPLAALGNRRLVANGATVRLVYDEDGLSIVTSGAAMQDGAAGDNIKVRNLDSGVSVSGVLQPDGSVRIGGG